MPNQGEVLGDRYRLDDRVAVGGMGEVWRATDTVLGRTVAVKLLHGGRAGDREFQTRFHHEARAMAALRYPGIADVHDYGETVDGAYIVMTYIEGQPLNERIAAEGRLEPATAMSVVAQAARSLDVAHAAGIVHRDVKPGNLIVQPDGAVVLVDFGVARSAGLAPLTGVNDVVGTALYIAPEQVSKEPTGPATDIYALGAVAYHCVAGRPPFMGNNPIDIAVHHLNDDPPPLPADVPAPVRELIATAMAKRPADRYPSAAAMAAAAEHAAGAPRTAATAPIQVAGAPIEAAGAPVVGRPSRRSRTAWGLVLLGLIVVAGAIAIALAAPSTIFKNPDVKPSTSTSTTPPGPSSAPAAPAATPSSAGTGRTSPRPGGSGTTTRPSPRPSPTPQSPQATVSTLDKTTAPITTGSQ